MIATGMVKIKRDAVN